MKNNIFELLLKLISKIIEKEKKMDKKKNEAGLVENDNTSKEEIYGITEIMELLDEIHKLFVELNERYQDGSLSAGDVYGLLDNVYNIYNEFQDWDEIQNEYGDVSWDEGKTILNKAFEIFKSIFILIKTILDKSKK